MHAANRLTIFFNKSSFGLRLAFGMYDLINE